MTLVSGRDRMMARMLTCTIWESGSCLLERVVEVSGVGELRDLVSRFGGVLASVGVAEKVFDGNCSLHLHRHLPLRFDDND